MSSMVILKKNEDRRISDGHLWVFSNEIERVEGEPQTGDIVELRRYGGGYLGHGFYHPRSLIAVRLLTRSRETIDFEFFRNRTEAALHLRRIMYPNAETFRLIDGESDFLPGLVVDKYNDCLSIQTLSYGMDKRLTLICDVLDSLLHPKGIVERNETQIRSLEGLPEKKGVLRGTVEPIVISEYGIKYEIDLLEGQKTGFFLDQRENRKAIRRYVGNAVVLDCFCNEGGFALNAAYADAAHVTGVDVSEPAINRAKANAVLNHLNNRCKFIAEDAFIFLRSEVDKGRIYDVINLDPPSFARTRKNVTQAKQGYKEIHIAAFKLLKPGGFLVTSSCSHHIFADVFLDIINESASKAGRIITLLEWRGAAPDHPVLPAMPETRYLKCGILYVHKNVSSTEH